MLTLMMTGVRARCGQNARVTEWLLLGSPFLISSSLCVGFKGITRRICSEIRAVVVNFNQSEEI